MRFVTYRFGRFQLDGKSYQLMGDGGIIAQPPKVLDLLILLASRPGELVTKDDILATLWPDVAVTDNAITQAVSAAREALGDDVANPQFIQTVPRKGYRFVASVEVITSEVSPALVTPADAGGARRIAVADFVNVAGDPETAWLSVGIAETVSDDLRALRDLRVVDRAGLPAAVRAANLSAAGEAALDLLIVGSFQRVGTQLRMAGRVVDVRTQESAVGAKASGPLADVFALQDELVTQLLQGLQLRVPAAAAARISARETSSLDAYQALTEGRIKLDSLDPAQVPGAIADFNRAIAFDPGYALAYAGLGHSHFWLHQRTRLASRSDREHLSKAIDCVREAIRLDPGLAEAQAALAFFLANSGDPAEAIQAGRTAVALEPNDWRHRFRLGIATWGTERLSSLREVNRLYPGFAFAYFASAMVHVARGDFEVAVSALQAGLSARSGARIAAMRFPSNGLHWLLGLIHLAQHDLAAARGAFERELTEPGSALYADEYAVNAHNALGYTSLRVNDCSAAAASFRCALTVAPGHARALIGLADAARRAGRRAESDAALAEARQAIEDLDASGRPVDAAMALAQWQVVSGRPEDALATLRTMLDQTPPGHAGWTLLLEPWLVELQPLPSFAQVVRRLQQRAM